MDFAFVVLCRVGAVCGVVLMAAAGRGMLRLGIRRGWVLEYASYFTLVVLAMLPIQVSYVSHSAAVMDVVLKAMELNSDAKEHSDNAGRTAGVQAPARRDRTGEPNPHYPVSVVGDGPSAEKGGAG